MTETGISGHEPATPKPLVRPSASVVDRSKTAVDIRNKFGRELAQVVVSRLCAHIATVATAGECRHDDYDCWSDRSAGDQVVQGNVDLARGERASWT